MILFKFGQFLFFYYSDRYINSFDLCLWLSSDILVKWKFSDSVTHFCFDIYFWKSTLKCKINATPYRNSKNFPQELGQNSWRFWNLRLCVGNFEPIPREAGQDSWGKFSIWDQRKTGETYPSGRIILINWSIFYHKFYHESKHNYIFRLVTQFSKFELREFT